MSFHTLGVEVCGWRLGVLWRWQAEEVEKGGTDLEKTLEVINAITNEICNFLTLTIKSYKDFPDNRLPTPDLSIWVTEENVTVWSF